MAVTEFIAALNQVATERGISVDSVLESIRLALASAYKKDKKEDGEEIELEEIEVKLNPDTGEAVILKDGKDVTPSGFGRIAAQTAKQVILQKIRETEKQVILTEYKSKLGTLVNGHVFRMENGIIILDLGKAQGVLPQFEQVPNEQYRLNQRLKVLVKDIRESSRGTDIIVSRADPEFVKKLFEQEVPEVASGVVRIEAIAREPGSRTKMAVSSGDEKVDAVGSCVGQKGVRVQSIISELFGEKIDIIPYSNNTEKFIASSLSPAKVTEVVLDEENKRATVSVPEDQQSLAIGKEGQNARLANKLTRWRIDIKGTAGLFGSPSSVVFAQDDKDKLGVRGIWDAEIRESKVKLEVLETPETLESPTEEDQPKAESAEEVEKTE